MFGLRLHLSLHTAVRELLCGPREILCTFSPNGSRGTIKPLWAVLAPNLQGALFLLLQEMDVFLSVPCVIVTKYHKDILFRTRFIIPNVT